MTQFLKEWGSLIIAIVALIQPWAMSIWRKYIRRGTIDIHETFSIEVGFSSLGATLGLFGTLRAMHKDQFVRSIELVVTKTKDSSKHLFQWGFFRPPQVSLGTKQDVSLELPSGFMLTTTEPRRYNILFYDTALQAEMRPHIEKVSKEWYRVLTETDGGRLFRLDSDPMSRSMQLEDAYSTFSKAQVCVQEYTALDRLCYWEPGQYELEMRVNTARPERTFSKKWTFGLSESEKERLRLNVVGVVQEVCGRTSGPYNFAYLEYKAVG
jgi:hypothetical protein